MSKDQIPQIAARVEKEQQEIAALVKRATAQAVDAADVIKQLRELANALAYDKSCLQEDLAASESARQEAEQNGDGRIKCPGCGVQLEASAVVCPSHEAKLIPVKGDAHTLRDDEVAIIERMNAMEMRAIKAEADRDALRAQLTALEERIRESMLANRWQFADWIAQILKGQPTDGESVKP